MVMQSSLHKGNLVVLSQKTQALYVSHINAIVPDSSVFSFGNSLASLKHDWDTLGRLPCRLSLNNHHPSENV